MCYSVIPDRSLGIRADRIFERQAPAAPATPRPAERQPERWQMATQTGGGQGLVRVRRRKMR